jgi:hypothetical protein
MDERLRFVARLLEGEKMAPLCAELGYRAERGDLVVTQSCKMAFRERSPGT